MKLLLCVPGTGKAIGRSLLHEILDLGFHGVRVDVPDTHFGAQEVLKELARAPEVYPVFLIAGGKMVRSAGHPFSPDELVTHVNDVCIKLRDFGFFKQPGPMDAFKRDELPAIEIGNEPNLAHRVWSKYPALMAETFNRCHEIVRSYSEKCPVLTPSISNLTWSGFRYLKKMMDERLPQDAKLAVHRYPHEGDVYRPHPGFSTREDQAEKLVKIAEGRDIWLTETGLTEGPHSGNFRSEDYVRHAFEHEAHFWKRHGVKAMCWYGINDGPDRDNTEHHFGIRRLDGAWKKVAKRVAAVRAAMVES